VGTGSQRSWTAELTAESGDDASAQPARTRHRRTQQCPETHETTADGAANLDAGPDTAKPPVDSENTSDEENGNHRRLPPGGLRGMVEDWLRDHAGEEHSPSTIGRALGRSPGAVANALNKLVADGYAVQTRDKPKRFTTKASVDLNTQN